MKTWIDSCPHLHWFLTFSRRESLQLELGNPDGSERNEFFFLTFEFSKHQSWQMVHVRVVVSACRLPLPLLLETENLLNAMTSALQPLRVVAKT
jgi:hypothetical protein